MHVLGVDRRHDERRRPLPGGVVLLHRLARRLRRPLEARRQRKRIAQRLEDRRIALARFQRRHQAGNRAARKPALHLAHAPAHALQRRAQPGQRLFLRKRHADIERDRVEPAREHDPRARSLRDLVILGDHRRHPGWLAAQVDIVRPGLHARRHHRLAVELVRPHRRDDHLRRLRHRRQRRCISSIRDDNRQLRRRADLAAHGFQLALAAPGDGPAHIAAHAIGRQHVLRHEAAGKPGRSVDDHVIRPSRVGHAHPFASRCAT